MKQKKEKSTFQWIMEFASIHKGMYILSVIIAILGVVCSIIPFFLIGKITTELLSGNRDWDFYLREVLVMAVLWLFRGICHSISTTCSHKATFHVLGTIRKRLCDKLAKLPLGYVLDTPSGSLKNIMVEWLDSIETTLAHILPEFTSNLLAPLCILIYLFAIDWRMTLASLITLPLAMVCYMGMMIGYEDNYKNVITKTKRLNDTAVEYINGIEVIKAFGKAESSYEKFVVAAREGAECYVEWMRSCNVFFSLAMTVAPSTMIAVLPIGGLLCKNGSLAPDDFIMTIILSVGLITPLITCMSYSDDIGRVRTIVGEVTEVLTQPELKRPEKSRKQPENDTIHLSNVTFGYHEKEILHGINMEIKAGTVNALVGPSGSGKSTIAKLIASLWDVKDGSISVGDVDIREMALEDYNRRVAYVSQDNFLFDETIRENIRMGRQGATDAEVEEVARKSGCHDFIMQLENGYDTVVGGAGGHLSGGERQRIAIARAMLKDAPIVILDETTAYTDPENEAIIQASVAKLVKGKTLIVIAHRLSTIMNSDQIFVVKDGNIDSQGTHEELLALGGLYKEMWEAHISVKDAAEGGALYA